MLAGANSEDILPSLTAFYGHFDDLVSLFSETGVSGPEPS